MIVIDGTGAIVKKSPKMFGFWVLIITSSVLLLLYVLFGSQMHRQIVQQCSDGSPPHL